MDWESSTETVDNSLMGQWKPPRRRPIRKLSRVPTGIGNATEQKEFLAANPARIKAIENVYATAKQVFIRRLTSNAPADRVGFYLGRICVEEFSEILLLAGNGHGIGALKILRGMYERAVTSAFILANPDQTDAFLEYDKVNKHRAYMHAKKLGEHGPRLTPETIKRIEDEFEAVKPMFLNGTRVRGSWTKLDTASLAQKAGPGYEALYLDAFYKPTLELHTTATSVLGRLELTEKGIMSFDSGPKRIEAGHAIVMAHNLLLRVLDSQNAHFKLGLDKILQGNLADFQNAYASGNSTD
jgi:Family of unknown function (DUF5677)